MFILKNYKYLLLLILFASAGQNSWAISDDFSISHDSHLKVKVATGNGYVYAKENNKGEESAPSLNNCVHTEWTAALTNTKNENNRPAKFYILALPEEGYEFDYWECTKNEGDDDVNKADAVGTRLTIEDSQQQTGTTWAVKAALSVRPNATSSSSGDESTVINAVWEAHFKQITTQAVDVKSENSSLGTATINNGSNTIGDDIMLTASCASTNVMFKGWYKINEDTGQKKFVTDKNPYSFKITEGNKGTYYARFEDGYYFWRLKNNDTQHYVTSRAHYTGDTLAINLQPALKTQLGFKNDLASSITDAGTMMNIYVAALQASTDSKIWDIYVQNEHTRSYYDEKPGSGAYLAVSHQADNTYLIQTSQFYVIESNGEFDVSMDLNNIRPYGKWQLEGMDKDLTTKKNYFAPSNFVGPDANGNYWTTLRVCFSMKYDTNEITPYIVTDVDESTGTMSITEVTGGIIPAKKCVLLKCNSTDNTRNVMIPTKENSSFNTDGNLLTSSVYYYKDQQVSQDDNLKNKQVKGLMVNSEGQLAFGGGALSEVNGNEAYLCVSNDVILKPAIIETTLANIESTGKKGETYTISDELVAVYAIPDRGILWCKDQGNVSIAATSIKTGQTDFMRDENLNVYNNVHNGQNGEWDQSNWVMLKFPEATSNNGITALLTGENGAVGKKIAAGTVTGRYTDDSNYTIDVLPNESNEYTLTLNGASSYTKNVYCTANFIESNTNVGENTGFEGHGKKYFFMNPKIQEVCEITYAAWDGVGDMFVKPDNTEVPGAFNVDWRYNSTGGKPTLQDNKTYRYIAVVSHPIPITLSGMLKADPSNNIIVMPLNLTGDSNIVTAINVVPTAKVATRVTYYNTMGVASNVPHHGINIMVIEYSDGSRNATKVLK